MKNPTPEERNTKSLAFMIIIAFIITILMRGVNTRFDVPHILYIACAAICGIVGIISYVGFVYLKMFKPNGSKMAMDLAKIIFLGILIYFTVSFSFDVVSNM